MERTSDFRRTFGYILGFLLLENVEQLSLYGLSTTHGGTYPLPSSLIIILTEITKLVIVLLYAVVTRASLSSWEPSVKLFVVAACYFCSGLIFLRMMPSTSPPIWMVLAQTRTLYTALAYRVVFGREVGRVQLVGCVLVMGSLPVARASELYAGHHSLTAPVIVASQLAALLSAIASLVNEMVLKNDRRSVVEQQAWLYVWGSLLAGISLSLQSDLSTLTPLHLQAWSLGLVAVAVVSASLAGLCIPFIVRNLDSIAKDYLAALNNTVLSVMTAMLFPLSFALNHLYLLSLAILLSGIWLYEKKRLPCSLPSSLPHPHHHTPPPPPHQQPHTNYTNVNYP